MSMQLQQHSAGHGPSLPQAHVLGAHLATRVGQMWPHATTQVVPPRSDVQGSTALHAAALCSTESMALLLLDIVTQASQSQLSARTQATLESSMLMQLLRARDAHGRTPLHVAAGVANFQARFACVSSV